MKLKVSAITALVLLALTVSAASADIIPVGYNRIPVPANSDVNFTVAFNANAEGTFTVTGVAGGQISVSATLQAGAYANLYYARFITGNGEGLWCTISANGTGSITIDASIAAYVNVGDQFRIYKHHTIGSLFPKALYGISFTNGTQILIFENNLSAMAQNKSAAKTGLYTTAIGGGSWIGAGVNNNTILPPQTRFVLRNNSAQTFTVYLMGEVPDYNVSMLIAANGDLEIGSGYPVPVKLKDAGLEGLLRQVIFYDNTATGINKSGVKTALYTGAAWVGAGVTGNELIGASESVTLRLPASETGSKETIIMPYSHM